MTRRRDVVDMRPPGDDDETITWVPSCAEALAAAWNSCEPGDVICVHESTCRMVVDDGADCDCDVVEVERGDGALGGAAGC